MIRLVLIDDEMIVLEGVKKLIKWEELGFELVGCAVDGEDGLKKVRKLKPDLVITDIRMPGLDGLSLIDTLKREFEDILFVIISGHSDFEYAKKALTLGVVDYLEKPITIPNMNHLLERIKILYNQKNEQRIDKQKSRSLEKVTLRKNLLEYLYSDMVDIHIKEWIPFQAEEVFAVFKGKIKGDFTVKNEELENVIKNKLKDNVLQPLIIQSKPSFIGILIGVEDIPKAKWHYAFEMLYKQLKGMYGELYMGVGEMKVELENLGNSYRTSKSALNYSSFKEVKEVVFYEDIIRDMRGVELEKFDETYFIQAIRRGKKEEVLKNIEKYLEQLKTSNTDIRIFKQECLRLIYLGSEMVEERNKNFKILINGNMLPHEAFAIGSSYKQMKEWMRISFETILEEFEKLSTRQVHHVLDRAKDYIDQYYNTEICLNEVAEKVGINPAYLSQLFKEKMGISYVRYITEMRLTYAKKLLDQGYKVAEVGEKVGYFNYRYFCDTFKKYEGITPSQYRENKR
ncbi:hypothetical protein CS063_10135 [Sporanaerobium hydrogeniformans]|uniref:Uncharacterized protein n=1 Tax=Sporanaerobium hydrogeniformans TaxID=3072179 RepID=A0AC61DBP3_9FIRM|nr:response regulator [Sporanaerobium hydrogeniformans]PHV70443.1 hypothetical protein CS063_10135 [Sporanaerobium hydrogeniformans]